MPGKTCGFTAITYKQKFWIPFLSTILISQLFHPNPSLSGISIAKQWFFLDDSLHLFSKNVFTGDCVTKQYVLPAKPGKYIAELRDSMVLKNSVVNRCCTQPGRQNACL